MKRGKFNLSNHKLFSCDMGELVPIGVTEVLPGDTIQNSTTCLIRMAPMLSPPMHPVHASISHWFVPYRLLWDNWEDFITGGPDGQNMSVFPTKVFPTGVSVGGLYDYLGVPTGVNNIEISALPVRAYQMIWNEWFRDQDLQSPVAVSTADGVDNTTSNKFQRVAWEKDYFTTSRPWEQKGPSITIPLGTTAPVVYNHQNTNPWLVRDAATGNTQVGATNTLSSMVTTGYIAKGAITNAQLDPNGNLETDLTGASAVTVNLLREALALQRFEEARARFGSRYVEYLRYLGVRSSDARLQRPEFLGGGRYPIQFSEVLQTAEGTDPVGTLRGHGLGVARSNRYRRFFEEHGIVISLMSVKPKTIYMQGLNRMWNRRTKEDFWQKELQHIGQQEVLNKEVYAGHSNPNGVFGFQNRYDEYRSQWSSVSGEFRTTLDFWHFARQFSSDPALNSTFVECVPSEDPFAVPSEDVLYVMAKHSTVARRLLAPVANSFIF